MGFHQCGRFAPLIPALFKHYLKILCAPPVHNPHTPSYPPYPLPLETLPRESSLHCLCNLEHCFVLFCFTIGRVMMWDDFLSSPLLFHPLRSSLDIYIESSVNMHFWRPLHEQTIVVIYLGDYRKTLTPVKSHEQPSNLVREIDKINICLYISFDLYFYICMYVIDYKIRVVRTFLRASNTC